jgi:hypothetical protein
MKDSNLREIPEHIGYSPAFILSIGLHGLLACAVWMGANIHQTSSGDATSAVKNLPVQLNTISTPARTASSLASPHARNTSLRPDPDDLKTPAPTLNTEAGRQAVLHSSGAAKTAPIAKAANAGNKKFDTQSRASPKQLSMKTERFADASKKKPLLRKDAPAKAVDKAKLAATDRSAKDRHTGNGRKALARQNTSTPDVAEIKKLESAREAELRRISKNLS